MKRRATRRAAAVGALCAVALLGGCGNTSGPQDLTSTWQGTLNLRLAGGGALGGALTLVLDQVDSFASGGAEWAPIGEAQSIAGPLDGTFVTLRLVFRCQAFPEAPGLEGTFQSTVLEGTIDGDTLQIEDASGKACTLGDPPCASANGCLPSGIPSGWTEPSPSAS